MIAKTCRWLLLSSLLMLPLALRAHHSPAMFDFSKQLTLTGTVRAFQWTNPHSYIQLVVEPSDGTGTKQEWSLEMGAPMWLANAAQAPSALAHLMQALEILKSYAFVENHGQTRIMREPVRKRVSLERAIDESPNAVLPLTDARPRTASTTKLRVTTTSGIQSGTTCATAKVIQ